MNTISEKKDAHSAGNLLAILRKLHGAGYQNLRFYSFRRWVGTLAIIIYREFPLTVISGEALYVKCAFFEVDPDLTFTYPCERDHAWGRFGITEDKAASYFSTAHLCGVRADTGAFNREYFAWLNSAIKLCPSGSLPITGAPNDLPSDMREIALYPENRSLAVRGPRPDKIYLEPPPGLASAIEPYEAYSKVLQDRDRTAHDLLVKAQFNRLTLIEKRIKG